MGPSRGGLTTKIHMMRDALGLPIKFILTDGGVSNFTQAIPLLNNEKADYVIADKGYDSYDKFLYKDRNLIERVFNRLKQFRRIAVRFEKIKKNFESLIYLVFYIYLLRL